MGAAAWPCPFLMQWRQRIVDAHDEDVGSEDDDVHQQTDTKEIAEAVAAGIIDQQVGGRTDRCGKAGTDADHQGDEERKGLITQLQCRLEHDREEHGSRRRVRDEFGDEGGHKTDSGEKHEIGAPFCE